MRDYNKLSQSNQSFNLIEQNIGQWDPEIVFSCKTENESFYFLKDKIAVAILDNSTKWAFGSSPISVNGVVFTLGFLNSNTFSVPTGADKSPTVHHYFNGSVQSKWYCNACSFSKIKYNDIWNGVSLELSTSPDGLKMEWYLESPQNISSLNLKWDGVNELHLDEDGNLIIRHDLGELIDSAPKAWQVINGEHVEVDCSYALRENGEFGFIISGNYESEIPLVIDPLIPYSTYLGGDDFNIGSDVAVNELGEAYVVGSTLSYDFPTTSGAFQTTLPGNGAAFISKFSADGSSLVFSTLLSGSVQEEATSVAIDSDGSVYVGGISFSSDFPVTPSAYQSTFPGGVCGFLAKLSPDGSSLEYATYLGGTAGENTVTSIALDDQKCVYATGSTASANFPVTPGAFQTVYPAGETSTSFITKLSSDGSALIYSSYLGGNNTDYGECVALDAQYSAYITGHTYSTDFPITPGAFQTTNLGNRTGFVTKVAPDGGSLSYSTYLGGSLATDGAGITVDSMNRACITGDTYAHDFPTTPGAFQTDYGSSYSNGFVTILNPTGDALEASTFIGNNGVNASKAIALGIGGRVYITGHTDSANFPITPNVIPSTFSGVDDCFVSIFSPDLSKLMISFYLGGSATDMAYAIAVGSHGDLYITGKTNSSNYPVTQGAFQTSLSGTFDAMLTRAVFQFIDINRASLSIIRIS